MRKGEQGQVTGGELVAIHEATGSLAGTGAVDTESRNVRVVLIRAGEAKSGRVFTQRALVDIAAAADGLRWKIACVPPARCGTSWESSAHRAWWATSERPCGSRLLCMCWSTPTGSGNS